MVSVNGEACPLTGQTADIQAGTFDGWTVSGPFTDGAYRIVAFVINQARTSPPNVKAKVVSWIIDRHRAGEADPLIDSHTFAQVGQRPPLTYDQRVERFFLLLRAMDFDLSQSIRTSGVVDEAYLRNMGLLSAWMELISPSHISPVLQAMSTEGLLTSDGNSFRLTAEGMRRLDSLSSSSAKSNQAFVAMWFAPEMDVAYDFGFEPAIIDNGYRALRIDKKEQSNKIDDEIISEIRKSRFVVADFTCQIVSQGGEDFGIPRGGVYYEAGFAQGLNIDVIWSVRADCISHVHFDTRQYAHIVWTDPADLRVRLKARIGAVIGQAPN